MVEGKGFVGHVSNNRALLEHASVQNAAEHGTPRNQAQPGSCRCPAGEALLCGPRRRSPGRGSRPSTPSWLGREVGDGRHLPEERPAVLDQPVSNPLAFSGSPHATLHFPKLPRRGCETTAGSSQGWGHHPPFSIAPETPGADSPTNFPSPPATRFKPP